MKEHFQQTWAGRSAALTAWIVFVLLWCVLMRQAFNAMPWQEMTDAGMALQHWRKPFAAAGLVCGVIGSGLCLGCLCWICLSYLTGACWNIALRRLAAGFAWGFLPCVLVLIGTVACLASVIFPQVANYWGIGAANLPGQEAFGVLSLNDLSWWNPAWLYVRMGCVLGLAWCLVQVWRTRCEHGNVFVHSSYQAGAGVSMLLLTLMTGILGFDLLAGTGKAVLSMFPIDMIVFVLLISLAVLILVCTCVHKRLAGAEFLPWRRFGAMLLALVLIKAYIVYSQYLVTWYAAIPVELSIYQTEYAWRSLLPLAYGLQLALPFCVLMISCLRRNIVWLCVCSCLIILGSVIETLWWFLPNLGVLPGDCAMWIALGGVFVVFGAISIYSALGALSVNRIFPES